MTLQQKILSIYPELTEIEFRLDGTILLVNDGQGDYIAKWEHPTLQRPTDEQLAEIN